MSEARCQNPECSKNMVVVAGHRPRTYCDDRCRQAACRARKLAAETARQEADCKAAREREIAERHAKWGDLLEASQHLLQQLYRTSPLLADRLAEAMRAEQRHASFQMRQEFDTNTLRGRIADLEAQIEDQQADELAEADMQEERLAELRQMLLAEGERLGYLELDLSQHQDLVAHLNAIPEGEAGWNWIAEELDAEGLLVALLLARQQIQDQAAELDRYRRVLESLGCPTLCKEKRLDKHLDEMGRIGLVLR